MSGQGSRAGDKVFYVIDPSSLGDPARIGDKQEVEGYVASRSRVTRSERTYLRSRPFSSSDVLPPPDLPGAMTTASSRSSRVRRR